MAVAMVIILKILKHLEEWLVFPSICKVAGKAIKFGQFTYDEFFCIKMAVHAVCTTSKFT